MSKEIMKPLPCIKCGGTDIEVQMGKVVAAPGITAEMSAYKVRCRERPCGRSGRWCTSKEQAIKSWNKGVRRE